MEIRATADLRLQRYKDDEFRTDSEQQDTTLHRPISAKLPISLIDLKSYLDSTLSRQYVCSKATLAPALFHLYNGRALDTTLDDSIVSLAQLRKPPPPSQPLNNSQIGAAIHHR